MVRKLGRLIGIVGIYLFILVFPQKIEAVKGELGKGALTGGFIFSVAYPSWVMLITEEKEDLKGYLRLNVEKTRFIPEGEAGFWCEWPEMPKKITDVVDTLEGYSVNLGIFWNNNKKWWLSGYFKIGITFLSENVEEKGFLFYGEPLEKVEWWDWHISSGWASFILQEKVCPYIGLGILSGKFLVFGPASKSNPAYAFSDRYTHNGLIVNYGVLVKLTKLISLNLEMKKLFPGEIEGVTGDIKGTQREIGLNITSEFFH